MTSNPSGAIDRFAGISCAATDARPRPVLNTARTHHERSRHRARPLLEAPRQESRSGRLAAATAAVETVHAVAGAELAAAWHLPEEVIEACRWHHEPNEHEYATLIAAATPSLTSTKVVERPTRRAHGCSKRTYRPSAPTKSSRAF